ncbi:hypothetical protein L873DRAFT_1803551 [Choiromyces venosus 120613-1]|uniref:Uncharacterized protein n=1 Tax=Choiromyces venosus 120613-1 TaxID=1336337 RepID=A0A3N4JZ30_9PEZI|nr:hypothetical protein L873DRAFT_1803551 [Choiromyces venosus 120613-1]
MSLLPPSRHYQRSFGILQNFQKSGLGKCILLSQSFFASHSNAISHLLRLFSWVTHPCGSALSSVLPQAVLPILCIANVIPVSQPKRSHQDTTVSWQV